MQLKFPLGKSIFKTLNLQEKKEGIGVGRTRVEQIKTNFNTKNWVDSIHITIIINNNFKINNTSFYQ